MFTQKLSRLAGAGIVLWFSAVSLAQEPRNTLWTFLGIPQAHHTAHGALFNRTGKRPGLERRPPVRPLAHPINLESDVPAIKKAAEIKQAEDLKPQKIKAVRYLAQIGCGCYDTDGSVTDALVAAMDDCTEEVRLATIEAISEAAAGQNCQLCGATCCCNEKISEQLFKMAYELDDAGCPLEPSIRVRQAAARALAICCPGRGPIMVQPPMYEPEREQEWRESGEEEPAPVPREGEAPLIPASTPAPVVTLDTRTDSTASIDSLRSSGQPLGVVILADAHGRRAHVHFEEKQLVLAMGTCVSLYKKLPDGTRYHGEAQVVKASSGAATISATQGTGVSDVAPGDIVIVGCAPVRVH